LSDAIERFSVVEADVRTLSLAINSGALTSHQLVGHYQERIEKIDQSGPSLHAVLELNPDALSTARALDREFEVQGPRSPLHGMVVLIKDNIASADKLQTTAGSLALLGARAPRDAFLLQKLRAAGVILLGKANMSEWANFRSTRSTSGWSARGGLTRNPYALDHSCSGSSSGCAAAACASLATLTVGTETDGSIVSPASICGLVGIKPTVGLISRDGIIPVSHAQDSAGPMTRSVADAAFLLQALAGRDDRDPATWDAPTSVPDYVQYLDAGGLRGARIGIVNVPWGNRPPLQRLMTNAVNTLRLRGAAVIEVELPGAGTHSKNAFDFMFHEFKSGCNRYLAEFGVGAEVKNLKEIIAFNERHHLQEMPHFGQELLHRAQAIGTLNTKRDQLALRKIRHEMRVNTLDATLDKHGLQALIAPTTTPAWRVDLHEGDFATENFSSLAAVSGYPHITVPAGFVGGLPVGLSFVGRAWSEATLIRLAYAFEQASHHRRAPQYLQTSFGLETIE